MPLRYRASLQDNWQPINANTYEFIAPLSVADRHLMRLFAHVVMVAYPPTPGYSQGYERDLPSATPIVDGIITGYELREYGEYRESYNGSETQTFVGIQIRLFTLDEPEGTDWFPAKAAGRYPYLVSGMTGIDNIVVTFDPLFSPPPYVNSPCILRAYLEGVLVFNQLFDGCPYVEVVDQPVCPPDTCEVDCGTHVCCYGSDGVSVFSFSK